jgi:hypothetical protein
MITMMTEQEYALWVKHPGYPMADLKLLGIPWLLDAGTPENLKRHVTSRWGLTEGALALYKGLFEISYKDLPKHLHEKNPLTLKAIKWRLTIGK